MEIIPAIDLIEGKCVRLSKGDYGSRKEYSAQPLEVARRFEDAGIRRLHLVDLDGAKAAHIVNWKVLENISAHTSLVIDFGGGLKSDDDLRIAFECGATMVTGGSIAVRQPEVFRSWLQRYGSERIILGADVRDRMISVNGWTEDTAWHIEEYLEGYLHPQEGTPAVTKVVCTDIDCDGMLQGPSVSLYRHLLELFPSLYLIASGGVSSMADLDALSEAGLPAVIFGKALYEGRISLDDLKPYLIC